MVRKGPELLLFLLIPMVILIIYSISINAPLTTTLFYLTPLLIGAIGIYILIIKPWMEFEKILKIGEPAEATILKASHKPGDIRQQNSALVEFDLEVRPAGKTAYQAKAKAFISGRRLKEFQPGRVLKVKYDPNDMQRVALVP